MDEQDRRRARNEAGFRALNEQIRKMNGFGSERAGVIDIVCECSSTACSKIVSVTLEEYEAVRAIPTWFLIAPGHDEPKIESVLVRDDRFAVVEKIGEAAAVAEQTDPRH